MSGSGQPRTLSHHAGSGESGQEELSFTRYKRTTELGAALSNARWWHDIPQWCLYRV